jgi:hypothetical protein
MKGETYSPVKTASEVCRALRDTVLRHLIETGLLSASDVRSFFAQVSPAINRLVVGPPWFRQAELLALANAGILRFAIDDPDMPNISLAREKGYVSNEGCGSTQMLLNSLAQGGVDVTAVCGFGAIKVDATGRVRSRIPRNLFVAGIRTEGSRYYNTYVPSTGGRTRAWYDVDAVAKAIFSTNVGQ